RPRKNRPPPNRPSPRSETPPAARAAPAPLPASCCSDRDVSPWPGASLFRMTIAGATGSAAALAAAREFGRRLRARFGSRVVDLRLFGSTARGEAHEESDVDIAVVLDTVDWDTRAQAIDLATTVGL